MLIESKMLKSAAIVIDGAQLKGAILPVEWWIEKLSGHFELDLFVLDADLESLRLLKKYKKVQIIKITTNRATNTVFKGFFAKALARKMIVYSVEGINFKTLKSYNLICAGPITSVEAAKLLFNDQFHNAVTVAIISDSALSTYKYISRQATRLHERVLAGFKYWITKLLQLEENTLNKWDYVIVQSLNDKEALTKKRNLDKQITIKRLPNGVSGAGFQEKKMTKGYLDREIDVLLWSDNWRSANAYVAETINELCSYSGNYRIQLLGSTADYFEKLESSNAIEILNWLPDLQLHLSNVKVLVVPAFKNFGLINRVLDGMNAGCIVISEQSAFNGILGFENGIHGFIAPDGRSSAKIISNIRFDRKKALYINDNTRKLINSNHSWIQHENFYKELASEFEKL